MGNGPKIAGTDPKEYADLKFEAAVSENRAIATEVHAELDKLENLIKGQPGVGWLIGIALAIVAAIVAVIQFGGAQFSGGYAASSAYAQQLEAYRADMAAQVEQTNAQIGRNTDRLESIEALLIEAIDREPQSRLPESERPEEQQPEKQQVNRY